MSEIVESPRLAKIAFRKRTEVYKKTKAGKSGVESGQLQGNSGIAGNSPGNSGIELL